MVAASSSVGTREAKALLPGTWGQAVLLLLIATGAYVQTWIDLWPYWEAKNATYAHGTLIVLVAGWFVWRTRPEVDRIAATPSFTAFLLTLLLSSVWLLAERANVFIVYAALWPLLAFAALWAGLGMRAASRFALPLGFLYFAIPVWEFLKPPLQAIVSTMASWLASIIGIPAVFDGPYATMPTGSIFIAEDCSGARFLCVALAIGVIAGVLRRDNLQTRLIILAVAALLSTAFNSVRIVLILIAKLNPSLGQIYETMGHLTLGWWVFAIDLVVFALILRFIPRSDSEPEDEQTLVESTPVRQFNRTGLGMSATALILLPVIAWVLPSVDTYPSKAAGAESRTSMFGREFVAPDQRWSPHYPGVAWEYRFAAPTTGGITAEVYGNQYHEQSQGRELISRGSHLFDPMVFDSKSSSIVELEDSAGKSVSAHREVLTDSTGDSWLAMYTYFVDGRPITSRNRVQLTTALRSIYSRTTAGVVAVATPCVGKCDVRNSDLEDAFVRAFEGYRAEPGN